MANDYLMRQIETMARAIALFIFNKKDDTIQQMVDEEGGFAKEHFLRYMLQKYLLENKVNEAENILFETVEHDPDPVYLPVAAEFYSRLLAMEESALRDMEYSRGEIHDGLRDIMRIFGVEKSEEMQS